MIRRAHDGPMLERLRERMRLPWRVRHVAGAKPGIQDALELPLLMTGAIRVARSDAQQAAMVRFAVVAANALPRLLLHCHALERQLAAAGLDLGERGLADEVLAALELADEEVGDAEA